MSTDARLAAGPPISAIGRAYLDAALDCVVMVDAAGLIVEFNPAAERTFGRERGEVLGRPLGDVIIPPSLRQQHDAAFARFARDRESTLLGERLEFAGMRSDGTEFPVELALSVVDDEPLLICGALRDLTDAKRAEADLRLLANEHAALRRVAMLIAGEASPSEVFAAVAHEVSRTLGVALTAVIRFESDGTATQVGASGSENPFPVGTSWILDEQSVSGMVARTGRPARVDEYEQVPGPIAATLAQAAGIHSAVGVPVLVEGRAWGVIMALSTLDRPLPPGVEVRLAAFTELIATAIANAQARDDLRKLVDEQTALRRIATLVARQASPEELFSAVAEESTRLLDVGNASVLRFDDDGSSTLVGTAGPRSPYAVGDRYPPHPGVIAEVWRTRRAAMISYDDISGDVVARLRSAGLRSAIGVPIPVDGDSWGVLVALATDEQPLAEDAEARLTGFAELVAIAIANAQARDDLRGLVEEQVALRRVAILVAEGADPATVFDAVCEETGRLLGASSTNLARFTADGFNQTMSGWSLRDTHVPTGTRLPLGRETINGIIQHTAAPARVDTYDAASGDLAALIRARGIRSEVGAPVIVEGRVWGGLIAGTDSQEPLPAGAETKIASFAELIGTAVANASSRSELVASRARLVTAGDQARRRLERDLHDGTQQRLIALGMDVQRLRNDLPIENATLRQGLANVATVIEAVLADVRELSRGLHPPLLAQGGLVPALRALARSSPLAVELSLEVTTRPPEVIETAAYFVVAEALTNAAKHGDGETVTVSVERRRNVLAIKIADDGIGGAEPSGGSGIIGLIDRVEALGGRFALDSPAGGGTRIEAELPLQREDDEDLAGAVVHSRSLGQELRLRRVADSDTLLAAFLAVADALYLVDARGCIRYLNPAAVRVLGYDDETQLLGRPSHDTIHYLRPDGTPFPAAECPLLRPRITGERVRVDRDWFIRQDGSFVEVTYSSAPVDLPDGRGAVVSFRDI